MQLPREAWGNASGWAMATAMVLCVLVALVLLHSAGAVSTPTAFGADPRNYGPIELPVDLTFLGPMEGSGDAGSIYLEVAEAYAGSLLSRRPYDALVEGRSGGPAAAGTVPLLEHLVVAAQSDKATIFSDRHGLLINDQHSPELEALYTLGEAANRQAGLLAARAEGDDLARARRLYEAAYVLGVHLARERIVHRELELGYRLISSALGGLAALSRREGDELRAEQLSEARSTFMAYVNDSIQPVWAKLSAINDVSRENDLADVHAGDVFAIASSPLADRLWRTEAILRLGKMRHDATRPVDRRGAQRYLEHFAQVEQEPHLKLAAERALALSAADRMHAR